MQPTHTGPMHILENPIVQKALAGIVTAGVVAFGGMTISTRDKVRDHDLMLKQVTEMRGDVGSIKDSIVKVEKDVAIMKDREARKDERRPDHQSNP